jgi:hypothetical protein
MPAHKFQKGEMMRDLTAERNAMPVQDFFGDEHEIYFRNPTTTERMKYRAGMWERQDDKVVNKTASQRMVFGAAIIVGFKKGSLGADGKPIASDPADPDYREDWKDLLCAAAPDVVDLVAQQVFEGGQVRQAPATMPEIVIEDAEPLGK